MTEGIVISLEMLVREWVIADLNQARHTLVRSVKEQRVDGSSIIHRGGKKKGYLYSMVSSHVRIVRCTLVARETWF